MSFSGSFVLSSEKDRAVVPDLFQGAQNRISDSLGRASSIDDAAFVFQLHKLVIEGVVLVVAHYLPVFLIVRLGLPSLSMSISSFILSIAIYSVSTFINFESPAINFLLPFPVNATVTS